MVTLDGCLGSLVRKRPSSMSSLREPDRVLHLFQVILMRIAKL